MIGSKAERVIDIEDESVGILKCRGFGESEARIGRLDNVFDGKDLDIDIKIIVAGDVNNTQVLLILRIALTTIGMIEEKLGGKIEKIIGVEKKIVRLDFLPDLNKIGVRTLNNIDNAVAILKNKTSVEIEN